MINLVEMVKVLEPYMLKHVARQSSNVYDDDKAERRIDRHETTAEHVYSTLRLADYFLSAEEEFSGLDQKHVYELILYHDDAEILTKDTKISDRNKRKKKEEEERRAIPILATKYPRVLEEKLLRLSEEYRKNETPVANFVHAVDKMDALLHELQYPNDWGPKNFGEENVRAWFQPSFDHSPTFAAYFESVVQFLDKNGYFKVEQERIERVSVSELIDCTRRA